MRSIEKAERTSTSEEFSIGIEVERMYKERSTEKYRRKIENEGIKKHKRCGQDRQQKISQGNGAWPSEWPKDKENDRLEHAWNKISAYGEIKKNRNNRKA